MSGKLQSIYPRKIKIRRSPYGLTKLELIGKEFDLELKILSRQGKQERRALIKSFLRQIKPWLQYFKEGAIDHPDCTIIRNQRAKSRGAKADQGQPIDTPAGALGYEIRMKRLKLGLSQSELAKQLQISRPHLSGLERGLHIPHEKTWKTIKNFLSESAPEI
jgi:DNA-binding XRE family transcriptional regulator